MSNYGRGRGQRGHRGQTGGGRGRGGAHGTGSGSSGGICFEFRNKGTCTRTNCRFSHDLSSNGEGTNVGRARVEETEEQREARWNYKDWKKFLGPSYTPSDTHTMKRVWDGAAAILQEDDRDWKQQLPHDLNESTKSCNGRAHIKAILMSRVKTAGLGVFIDTSKSFLDVITHPSLLDCLAVDTYVGGIYNFLSGTNGHRGLAYFQHVCETMVAARIDDTFSGSQTMLEQLLIRLAVALYELLKRDQRARLNDHMEVLVEAMANAVEIVPAETPSTAATVVNKHIGDIQQMIARAKGLVQNDDDDCEHDYQSTASNHVAVSYPRDLVIPSDRFDNDKKDITNIAIFPTRDEIMSEAKEFLPSTDLDQPHFLTNQLERHLDTQFRLLRHDIFGDMKKALANFMYAATDDSRKLVHARLNLGDMRVYTYPSAHVSYLAFEARKGLQAQVSFPQPQPVRKKSFADRLMWWEDSRRLDEGSLLSMIWMHGSVVEQLFLTVSHKNTRQDSKHSLTSHDALATITTKLLDQEHATLQKLLQLSLRKTSGILLEFPKIIPATFVPILKNLQGMQRLSRLPFRQWILPVQHGGPPNRKIFHKIPPPLYARRAGFVFPLQPILKDQTDTLAIDPAASCDDSKLIEEIASKTQLDPGQCRALLAALTREFTFIQGPPGTGKSYVGLQIMQVLLGVKAKADIGPIIVVCYTNHALDQFLEHLLKIGIKKVIRMGGQSRSDLLAGCNLRDVAHTETKTRNENYQIAVAYKKLEGCEKDATKALGRLHGIHRNADWDTFNHHVSENYPKIYSQLRQVDEDGFTTVGRTPFEIWINSPAALTRQAAATDLDMDQIIAKAALNIHSLNLAERRNLVAKWKDEICLDIASNFYTTIDEAVDTQKTLTDVHDETDRRVLQGADVIGVTTSGLAKRISVLQHVKSKVIICEEAGEVMEPHLISAMLPTMEHCIQIGDHEQLRPSITNFKELSLESIQGSLYKLDRSQFERLSVGEKGRPLIPVAQLEVQRRMRPEVSILIRETVYPRLIDHPSTLELPDVVGMRKTVFWLDHRQPENDKENDIHSKSSSNSWEVDFVHALVRHVVRQGVYNSSDIAVLTPYTGQLQKLRSAMQNDFEIVLSDRDQEALEKDGFDVDNRTPARDEVRDRQDWKKPLQVKKLSDLLRVATVDNFQGEEAKVIIVSLVRSNDKQKVGFLKTTNRINVLLSRAQHGMYLIGNSETYANVRMWQQVIEMLRGAGSIGDALSLCCPRHPEKVLEVREPDDFKNLSPEGGCNETCTERLTDCGHQCQARCHSKSMHDVWKCEKPCQRRLKPCDHPCQKTTCGEDCGRCMVSIDHVKLPCEHIKRNVECHKTLDLGSISCDVTVTKEVPECKHNVDIKCFQDVTKESFKCPAPCGTLLPCGHPCPGSCGRCSTRGKDGKPVVNHFVCKKKCGRASATCNHNCSRSCHSGTDCGLCQNPCEVRCKHSRCVLKCHEPCAPCTEMCVWECEHQGRCTMPCAAPCNRLPCNERCTKLLPCGHQCPSICGEKCPVDYCQACSMKSDQSPDIILGTQYSDIDLNESPIVVLGCGHFWTTESLDGQVGLNDVYEMDAKTGQFVTLKDNPELTAKVPKCLLGCGQPIRQFITQRYNRAINKAVLDEQSRRFIVTGQQDLQELGDGIRAVEDNLKESRKSLVPTVNVNIRFEGAAEYVIDRTIKDLNKVISSRYKEAIKILNEVKAFQKRTATRHHPVNRLQDAIANTVRTNTRLDAAMAGMSLTPEVKVVKPHLDLQITLGGCLLEIKIMCIVLQDKFSIHRAVSSNIPGGASSLEFSGGSLTKQIDNMLDFCSKLVDECRDAALPRLAVEATLYYASLAQILGTSGVTKDEDRTKVTEYCNKANYLLDEAELLCKNPFHGRDALHEAIEKSKRLLGKEFYEEVSDAELESIKQAMVTGHGGIATHSGHWYNCANGHPFCIGECGMPMELAKCPQCGSPIGGRHHRAVAGVTRATNME